jgi:hypothetical protein
MILRPKTYKKEDTKRGKTITINYTLGNTFAVSSDGTLFSVPFSQFLLAYDRVRTEILAWMWFSARTPHEKKGYHPGDSIDRSHKWDLRVPLKNQRRTSHWRLAKKSCWRDMMTLDDGNRC